MYTVDGKELAAILIKATDIIGLGDTSSNSTIRLDFTKEGLTVGAQNSAGTYRASLPCTASGKPAVSTAIVTAGNLLSFVKGKSSITLAPNEANLALSTKGFKANLFYLGSEYSVDVDIPKDVSLKVSKTLSEFVNDALSRTSDMKDRVEQKPTIIANLVTDDTGHFLSVGDTHHAVLVSTDEPSKRKINFSISTANMKRMFNTGAKMAILPTRLVSFTASEYLSLNATSDGEAASVANILGLRKSLKSKTKQTVDVSEVLSALSTLSVGTEAGTPVLLTVSDGKLALSVTTGASKATCTVQTESKGIPPIKVALNLLHLTDCMKAMNSRNALITYTENLIGISQEFTLGDNKGTVFAAVSAVAERT